MKHRLAQILSLMTIATCAFLASVVVKHHGSSSYYPLSKHQISKVNIWSAGQVAQLEETGKIGSLTVPDGGAFAIHIRERYIQVWHPSRDAQAASLYYVEIGTTRNFSWLLWGSVVLMIVSVGLVLLHRSENRTCPTKGSSRTGDPRGGSPAGQP